MYTMLFILIMNLSKLFANEFPQELTGRWKFLSIECVSGKLTDFGKSQLPARDTEHFLHISKTGEVSNQLIERGRGSSKEKYCETIYKGYWKVQDNNILKYKSKLQSRKGIGGYSCYPTDFPKVTESQKDWPYSITNNQLRTTHDDLAVAVYNSSGKKELNHTCTSGSPFIKVYKLQK